MYEQFLKVNDIYTYYENQADGEQIDEAETPGILKYCSMLYQLSAKCNENLTPNQVYGAQGYYMNGEYYEPQYEAMYQSAVQEAQESKVCGFIESLNSGTYKEDGTIRLGSFGWITNAGSRLQAEVSSATNRMNGFTKFLLFVLIVGSAAMGLWAMVLHGAIQRKMAPWQPKDPVDLARAESGIVMGRSRSGAPAAGPLI